MGSEDKLVSLMTMFLEENRRRDEETRRRDEENRRRDEENRLRNEESRKRDDVLAQLLEKITVSNSTNRHGEELITELISKTQMFKFDPECGGTFTTWIERFEDTVAPHGPLLSDEDRAKILLTKLDTEVYNIFRSHIRPQSTKDLKYNEIRENLESLFGEQVSLFRRRYNAIQVEALDLNFKSYSANVNRLAELAQANTLTANQFKCLLFVAGLKKKMYAEFQTRLLHKIESQPDCTLRDLCQECEHLVSLRNYSNVIEEVPNVIQTVQRNSRKKKPRPAFPCKEPVRPSTARKRLS